MIRYPGCDQVVPQGRLAPRYDGNLRFLTHIYETRNEWMLEPFQHRGQEWVLKPLRNYKTESAWAGEYAGKWLDASSLTIPGSPHEKLAQYAATFCSDLMATQEADSYLGIEVPARRGPNSDWDVWNVKYAMAGLLTRYEACHNQDALNAAARCGEWLIHQYGTISSPDHPFFTGTMDGGVNANILDELARLYRLTGEQKFLGAASAIVDYYPPIARMRETGQAPLWHAYNLLGYLGGVVEFAISSSHMEELDWVEKVWEDLAARHLYPTGSLGFNELLSETAPNDTPVDNGLPARHHQETCATVEWLLFNALLYQATGNVRYIEAMEQTIYNGLLAAQSLDGLQWMYFTPLRYEKRWFTGPTSCCYWSGPRGIARLPGWIYALDSEGVRVNLYESSQANVHIEGHAVKIRQSSQYPDIGKVLLHVEPVTPISFTLRLRIPPGNRGVQLQLNGLPALPDLRNDGYFSFHREWSKGDQILIEFEVPTTVRDFLNAHYGIIVRGSEVLAVDQSDNPTLDLDQMVLPEGILLSQIDPVDGRRRYQGEVIVDGRSSPVIFNTYADSGNKNSRFRTAFPK